MRIAVTGASGFVGGAVCRAATALGWRVHAFGRRRWVDPAHIGGAAYRARDLTRGVLDGRPEVDVVVHCAGSVGDWGPAAGLFAANVTGTASALASFPGTRFVHVSTASVYDPARPTVAACEDEAPVARYVNAYGASKAVAERLALQRGAVVLRPHAVYGPGDTTLLPRVLASVRAHRLWAIGDGRQRLSLTSVTNLAAACLLAARIGPVGMAYNVADAEPVTLDHALRALIAARGLRARPVYLPERLVRPLAATAEGIFLLARSTRPPRLTRYAVGHLAVERTLDITRARTILGYDPAPTDLSDAGSW